jgi:hypothetical protein
MDTTVSTLLCAIPGVETAASATSTSATTWM